MRLTPEQCQAIVETFLATFGKGRILLFGSRVDDHARGGDIDLYVLPDEMEHAAERRIDFLVHLKRRIAPQKIDLVLPAGTPRAIDRIACEQGIVLCENH
jgi:predicted nucleotidyltransferase